MPHGLATWLVAFPSEISTGCCSQTRPSYSDKTFWKWSCHLNASLYQFSEHRIRYRHHKGHLRASKWGAFLLTGQPWHLPGLGRVSHRETRRQTSWQIGPSPWSVLAHPAHCQGSHYLTMGWVGSTQTAVLAILSTKKPPPPIWCLQNGHCDDCTWSYVLKIGREMHLSDNFILIRLC